MYRKKYIKYKNKYTLIKKQKGGDFEKCNKAKKENEELINVQDDGNCTINENLLKLCDYDGTHTECTYIDNVYYNDENREKKKYKCIMLTKKCNIEKYYKFVYDGSKYGIDKKLNENNIFDTTKRDNCCNCISISLYTDNELSAKKVSQYIASIERTIKNVKRGLPDWIVRIFFDISVYNYINNIKDKVKDIKHEDNGEKLILDGFEYIKNQENTELYVVLCDEGTMISPKMRTMRYMPLYTGDTNIVAIREADGIVTLLDCYNLSVFATNNDPIYQIYIRGVNAINKRYDQNNEKKYISLHAYQKWYSIYKSEIDKDFFQKNWTYYDILAGAVAFKIMLNKEKFNERVNELTTKIKNFCIDLDKSEKKDKFKDIDLYTSQTMIQNDIKDIKRVRGILSTGFDEMLLTNIYKNLYSGEIERFSNLRNYAISVKPNKATQTELLNDTFKNLNTRDYKKIKTVFHDIRETMETKDKDYYWLNNSGGSRIFIDIIVYHYLTHIRNPKVDSYVNVECMKLSTKEGMDTINHMMNIPYTFFFDDYFGEKKNYDLLYDTNLINGNNKDKVNYIVKNFIEQN